MAGTLVSILRKSTYTPPVLSSGTSDVILAPVIDSLSWVSGALVVRQFAQTLSGIQLAVKIVNAMVGPDDPATVLTPASAVTPVATVTIVSTDAQGIIYVNALSSPISRYVRAIMTWQSPTTPSGSVTLAVDLVGRDA